MNCNHQFTDWYTVVQLKKGNREIVRRHCLLCKAIEEQNRMLSAPAFSTMDHERRIAKVRHG
jgi:hypothetical protein